MQYETVILELLTRVKKLEDVVEKLMEARADQSLIPGNRSESSTDGELQMDRSGTNVPYQKMTDEMIDICYKYGRKVGKDKNINELADDIADETGMNRSSAIMYLYAVNGMLNGTIYKRAISAKAMKRYFDLIFNEYGSAGLKRAIAATKLHIAYRRECGHMVDSIETICNQYEAKL